MKKMLSASAVAVFLLSTALLAIPSSADSTVIWRIGEFEPSSGSYSVSEQVNEFWQINVDYTVTFTIDATIVDQIASGFPRGIKYPGTVNIDFGVDAAGTYLLRYSRFGSEINNIRVDGSLVATVEGFGDGPGTDFVSLIYFDLASGSHTLTIDVVAGSGDTQTHYFEFLSLTHVTVWDLPHFDVNFQLNDGSYDDSGDFVKVKVKVPATGTFTITYLRGPVSMNDPVSGSSVDLDATDGSGTVYIPVITGTYHLYIFARGKPGGCMDAQYTQTWAREVQGGKPNVYKDGFPSSGAIPVWYINDGLTLLSIRWYTADLGVDTLQSKGPETCPFP